MLLFYPGATLWMSWTRKDVWVSELEIFSLSPSPVSNSAQIFIGSSNGGEENGRLVEYGEEMNFKLSLTFKL